MLPSGASRTVEIKAKDTSRPRQTLPYTIKYFANVEADLPDPNGGNNMAIRHVKFDPPKPTPTKAK